MIKSVDGFDGYQIDEEGNVYGKDGRVLKPSYCGRGYKAVALRKNGKTITCYIHRLVASNFIENAESKKTVNHKDGNRLNNSVENLEWNTYSENNEHARCTGLNTNIGSTHYLAKLKEEDVIFIRSNYKEGDTYQKWGDIYGLSRASIRDIIIGNTWKNLIDKQV